MEPSPGPWPAAADDDVGVDACAAAASFCAYGDLRPATRQSPLNSFKRIDPVTRGCTARNEGVNRRTRWREPLAAIYQIGIRPAEGVRHLLEIRWHDELLQLPVRGMKHDRGRSFVDLARLAAGQPCGDEVDAADAVEPGNRLDAFDHLERQHLDVVHAKRSSRLEFDLDIRRLRRTVPRSSRRARRCPPKAPSRDPARANKSSSGPRRSRPSCMARRMTPAGRWSARWRTWWPRRGSCPTCASARSLGAPDRGQRSTCRGGCRRRSSRHSHARRPWRPPCARRRPACGR